MSVVGFDIGNENNYIAAVKSGGIEILDNEYDLRSTPTYVAFTERSREVGIAAKAKVVTNFENTMFGFKRILGSKCNDTDCMNEFKYLPHKVYQLLSDDLGFKVNYLNVNTVFSTTQLMAMILSKLKMIAESKLGNTIRDCVISVPVYYTDIQRRAMLDAARIADLNPLKLMNESTAVALSYGFYKQDLYKEKSLNVIFVDFGNSSVTVTACAFTEEKLKILGCVSDNIGGRDFDNKLVQYFISDFKDKYQLDVMSNIKALMSLLLECESLKKLMSANSLELGIQIECFMNDIDVKGQMKRDIFENLCADLLNRVEKAFQNILVKTKLQISDIHSVEIVGGSSRLPAIKNLIRKVFKREPNTTLNQDEAVARGCALQCALLSPSLKTRDFIIEDIPSFIIKLVWKNMDSEVEELEVFSPSFKFPAFKIITFPMSIPFVLKVYGVDTLESSKRHKIQNFFIGNVPLDTEKGVTEIEVKANIDINGVFSISDAKLNVKSMQSKDVVALPHKDENEGKIDMTTEDKNLISPQNNVQSIAETSIATYELTITSDVVSLPDEKVKEFIDVEKQMIVTLKKERKKADARNALEEYIYDVRGKINYELNDYVEEEYKTQLLDYLCEMEKWLYDNEEQEAAEYFVKLEKCKHRFDPIFKRHFEWEHTPLLVNQYLQALQQSSDGIKELINLDETNIHHEKIYNIQKMLQDSKQFLEQLMGKFSNLKKCEDVPVSSDILRAALNNFQSEYSKKYEALKSEIDARTQKSDLASGDGNPDDVEKSVISNQTNDMDAKNDP